MSYPSTIRYQAVTIAIGESLSPAVSLNAGERVIGFVTPAAIEATTARLAFQACMTAGGTYLDIYLETGSILTMTFAVNQHNLFTQVGALYGVHNFKIRAETVGGVAVAQATAARTFYAIVEVF